MVARQQGRTQTHFPTQHLPFWPRSRLKSRRSQSTSLSRNSTLGKCYKKTDQHHATRKNDLALAPVSILLWNIKPCVHKHETNFHKASTSSYFFPVKCWVKLSWKKVHAVHTHSRLLNGFQAVSYPVTLPCMLWVWLWVHMRNSTNGNDIRQAKFLTMYSQHLSSVTSRDSITPTVNETHVCPCDVLIARVCPCNVQYWLHYIIEKIAHSQTQCLSIVTKLSQYW